MSAIEPYRPPSERQNVFTVPAIPAEASGGDAINLAGLVAAFRRRLGLFFTVLGATMALAILFLAVFPVQYTATARVNVEARTISVTPDRQTPVVSQLSTQQSADVDTEAQVIQSVRVVSRVVDKLHLERDPEFNGSVLTLKGKITKAVLKLFAPPSPVSQRDLIIANVLANLKPARFLTTNAIDINYVDHTARKAQTMADAFAQAYLDDQVESKRARIDKASADLMAHADKMRRQADDDAAKVQAYKVAHNLMSVGAQTLTEQEISAYNQTIATAKSELAGDLADLRTARSQLAAGSNGEDVGEALNSQVVGALRQQRAALSAKLADMQGHYGPKYPNLAQARQQVADLDQEIRAEIQRTISNLTAKAAVSRNRLATAEGTLGATKQSLASNEAALAGLENLQSAATVSQTIYAAYLNRAKESVAQASSLAPDADIVSRATLPQFPSFPNRILFIALGLVAGLLFGCTGVLLAEMTESRVLTARDVEAGLGCTYLGAIPLLASVAQTRRLPPADAVVAEPDSAYSEAFRAVRAATGVSTASARADVMLVTSALPQEGRTTLALGLARTSALQGVATVVVDADLRRRGLSRLLRTDERRPGLLELLQGKADLADVLTVDEVSGAQVLPLSASTPPASALFDGAAMGELLGELRERFRSVVIDSSPVLAIAATRIIAARADAVIVVARWRKTDLATLRAALRLLPPDQVHLAGVALNRVDVRHMPKYERGGLGRSFFKAGRYDERPA